MQAYPDTNVSVTQQRAVHVKYRSSAWSSVRSKTLKRCVVPNAYYSHKRLAWIWQQTLLENYRFSRNEATAALHAHFSWDPAVTVLAGVTRKQLEIPKCTGNETNVIHNWIENESRNWLEKEVKAYNEILKKKIVRRPPPVGCTMWLHCPTKCVIKVQPQLPKSIFSYDDLFATSNQKTCCILSMCYAVCPSRISPCHGSTLCDWNFTAVSTQ